MTARFDPPSIGTQLWHIDRLSLFVIKKKPFASLRRGAKPRASIGMSIDTVSDSH